MIFEVKGRGINVNQVPWEQAIQFAFQPVVDRYSEEVRSISILVDCESSAENRHGCLCNAKLALKHWPEFEITEHGVDQRRVIDRTAESVLRTLAVILR